MANIEDLAENYGVNDDGIDTEDKQPTIQDLASNYSLNPDMQKQLFAQYGEARKTAEAQRALLRDALEKNLINQQPEDKSEMYFKLAAALAAPSTTKGFGEPLMNVANAMAESRASERKQRNENIAKQLSSRQAIAELYGEDEKSLGSMLARYHVNQRPSAALQFAENYKMADEPTRQIMDKYLSATHNPVQPSLKEVMGPNGPQFVEGSSAIGQTPYHPEQQETPIPVTDPETGVVKYVTKSEALGMGPAANAAADSKAFKDATKDMQFVENSIQKNEALKADVEALSKHKGLSGMSGFNAKLPTLPESDTAQAMNLYEGIKGKMGEIAKANASATGSIGSMAIAEWPMLINQFAAIDPAKLGEKGTQVELKKIADRMVMYNNKLISQYQREHEPIIKKNPDRLTPKLDYGKQQAEKNKIKLPKPGDIDGNHEFIGGDPADPKNWREL
jgi:hypothetical protein